MKKVLDVFDKKKFIEAVQETRDDRLLFTALHDTKLSRYFLTISTDLTIENIVVGTVKDDYELKCPFSLSKPLRPKLIHGMLVDKKDKLKSEKQIHIRNNELSIYINSEVNKVNIPILSPTTHAPFTVNFDDFKSAIMVTNDLCKDIIFEIPEHENNVFAISGVLKPTIGIGNIRVFLSTSKITK